MFSSESKEPVFPLYLCEGSMEAPKRKTIVSILSVFLLTSVIISASNAQILGGSNTVGLWHMDEIVAVEYQETTPDATGINHGTLIKAPSSPKLVEGKFDKALKFDGSNGVYVPIRFIVGFPPSPEPIYVPISTNLDIQKELRVEAWVNVEGFKDAAYNNIVVKCSRTDASSENTTRVYGLAFKSGLVEKGYPAPRGILSGFVFTDTGGFNEIVTAEPVVTLNEWIHVAFTRSLTTGMHLYVNGIEKTVKTIHGVQNPAGSIINGTEVYFGHDSEATIDEIRISNLSPESETVMAEIDIGPNLLVALVLITIIFSATLVLRRAIQMWAIRSKP